MRAEIIAVGTEILTGQIVNTNAQFLSEKMAELGIDIYFQTAVGDNEGRLLSLLDIASQRSQLVILCGGLGPTEDDLTKQTLAKFLGKSLTVDLLASQKLDRFFASRPQFARTPNNERQAQLVEGSIPLQNLTGLAVGGIVTSKGVQYMVLPGPPSELKPMVMEQVVPILSNNGTKLYSRVLRFFGIGESQLVTILEDIIKNQTDPTIAPYAKVGEVTLRLSTKAENQDEADFKLDSLEKEILALKTLDNRKLKDLLYGYGDNNSMARTVLELLKVQNKTITAAESLTAGLFQSQLAEFSGASQVFNGGFTTYSMEAKSQLLGIPKKKLQEYGVVSHFTAEAMAQQARQLLKADFGIGLTGVAGPDELEGYPAGTVLLGLQPLKAFLLLKYRLEGRAAQMSVISVLYMLLTWCVGLY
ncbi:Competence-damage inducible protein [Streptococcus agalactiae]|nr:Competence-damage inducible protein [Streptococcus agalactiae]AUP10492.1 Competence-damage inducible protein [Streptococcus agalactiae]AUP13682.1 Competence-damage inducible protein [Streptococcus agalactiae]